MDEEYLADRHLAQRYKNSRATIWRWVETLGFPKPIRISPCCTRWRLSDVQAWEARMRSTSDGPKHAA